MFVLCVKVYVKKENIEQFKKAIVDNHLGTRQEKGNIRFDVLQSNKDPAEFFLYEAYNAKEDWESHKTTPHYLKWRETVQNWMDKPREGADYSVVAPTKRSDW